MGSRSLLTWIMGLPHLGGAQESSGSLGFFHQPRLSRAADSMSSHSVRSVSGGVSWALPSQCAWGGTYLEELLLAELRDCDREADATHHHLQAGTGTQLWHAACPHPRGASTAPGQTRTGISRQACVFGPPCWPSTPACKFQRLEAKYTTTVYTRSPGWEVWPVLLLHRVLLVGLQVWVNVCHCHDTGDP